MAITNAQIIMTAWMELVSSGVISEEEEIHTFDYWKKSGYIVKRGEKSVVKIPIWKHTTKKSTDENGNTVESSSMFMKAAYFFSTKQVEKIKPIQRITAAEIVGKPMTITINKKRKTRKEA